ncbi:hypothetical protein [Phocaeicola paurosaccharolyticus]|uniref:hypothetical protein n=1 Tax=Phocaeicola paurosaccharolyticus TaxID=732242 RepID=UPI002FE216E6
MEDRYLDVFEEKLQNELLRICTACKMLDGVLLNSDDIDDYWKVIAPEYIADAAIQIPDYPTVSVAWASFLGMAIAYGWDLDWEIFSKYGYKNFYGEQGFDDMDEHIIRDILLIPLESEKATDLEIVIRKCGETAVSMIRHEKIEPQSKLAFYIFARTCRIMYRIGASIELKWLGYNFEKVPLN